MSNADSLMYEEVVRILEYIQAHASVQDDNGVIHNANKMCIRDRTKYSVEYPANFTLVAAMNPCCLLYTS